MPAPNSNQQRPTFEESRRIWDRPIFSVIPDDPRLPRELITEIKKVYVNGGALFAAFSIAENSDLDWFLSANRLGEVEFLERLLGSDAFRAALPELGNSALIAPLEWTWTSTYVLDGEFASLLKRGGAYASYSGSGAEAKEIGRRACQTLFGERYEDILLFSSFTPWCSWFFDVAWDSTWIGLDKSSRSVWALCFTDAD
jgi:hypothetical protein